MRTSIAKVLAGVAAVAVPATSSAETLIVNDSVGEMIDGTTSSAELIEGEMYEATFEIPSDWLPVEMLGVRVVMVKNPNKALACGQFGIEVWEESSAASQTASCVGGQGQSLSVSYKDPGRSVFSQSDVMTPGGDPIGFEIKGDETRGNATFKDMRFSQINMIQGVTINPVMIETEKVRVGIRAMNLQCTQGGIQTGDHYPILVSDMNGVAQMETNFVYGEPLIDLGGGTTIPLCSNVSGAQHYVWEDFAPAFQMSQPGDFVMRLILNRDDPTGGDDMGMSDPDMGMGDPDMGTSDMGNGEADTGTGEADMGTASDMESNNSTGENNGLGGLMIESVTPGEGPSDASTDIAIIGTGFEAGAEVMLDAEPLGVKETKSERIRATVDPGFEPGAYDVVVTNPDGESAILMEGYTVISPMDVMGDTKSAGSDGCCSEVRGQRTSSALGFGIAAFLLAVVLGFRRRRSVRD